MSNKWEEYLQNGQQWFLNEELGNILKIADGAYVAMMPKVVKLGPFETVQQAQEALSSEQNKEALEKVLEGFNLNLNKLSEAIKGQ